MPAGARLGDRFAPAIAGRCRAGRVNHPNRSGYYDDLSNSTAGSLWRASAGRDGLNGMSADDQAKVLTSIAAMPKRDPFGSRPIPVRRSVGLQSFPMSWTTGRGKRI
jgi:hypothetical protein